GFTAGSSAPCWVSWLTDESGFVFHHPGALFAPGIEYVFDLGAGVASVSGNVNSLDHIWDLTSSAAPVLTSATPAEGATAPRDSPIVLSFSREMSPSAMAAAVSLTPGATGLQVVRNPLALGQFEVIPDPPLDPSTAYTLTVSRRATDAFGQSIPAPITLHFTTGPLSTTGHLLVLAGPGLGDATEVVLAQLTAPAAGLPLRAGATWPAWSPDGSTLAFVAANSSVQLYDPISGSLSALQPGSAPSGTPVWTADGDALAIPVTAAGKSPAHVDLADPAISARYQLPGLAGSEIGRA